MGGRRLSEFWAHGLPYRELFDVRRFGTVRLFRLPVLGKSAAGGVHLTDLTAKKGEVSLRPEQEPATGR
jgi:hypothetical protein